MPTLPRLIACAALDSRLTRTMTNTLFVNQYGSTVSGAAYYLTKLITGDALGLEPKNRTCNPWGGDFPPIYAIRYPKPNLWLALLANDHSDPREWVRGAHALVWPEAKNGYPNGIAVWSRLEQNSLKSDPIKMRGEVFRSLTKPSVTDLLLDRIKRTDDLTKKTELLEVLAKWEPKAALEPMIELTPQCRNEGKVQAYISLILKRVELGDRKALEDYAHWIRASDPERLDASVRSALYPLCLNPTHPEIAAAAEWMFTNKDSPQGNRI